MNYLVVALRPVDRCEQFHGFSTFLTGHHRIATFKDCPEKIPNLKLMIVPGGVYTGEKRVVLVLPVLDQTLFSRYFPKIIDRWFGDAGHPGNEHRSSIRLDTHRSPIAAVDGDFAVKSRVL